MICSRSSTFSQSGPKAWSHMSLPLGYALSAAGIALGLLAWWRHRHVTSAGTSP
ncbi:MAG: hypothetical protein KDB96_04135 [Flavobacteriales bacterium]|nr:hypothetical protein [Flavobacteriales bacterium]